jgi:hypothetical protein
MKAMISKNETQSEILKPLPQPVDCISQVREALDPLYDDRITPP